MTCSQMILNWLLGIVSENVPPIWNLSFNKVKHIKNGTKMWNTIKCFMSEVKRLAIAKFCWKAKMKDWDYMSAIKVWDNVHNDFNIKYMAINNPPPPTPTENRLQSHVIFKYISEYK